MGSGATLVDGVRRWFQRCSSSSSTSTSFDSNNPNKSNRKYLENTGIRDNDGHVFVSHFRAQRGQKQGEERELTIVEEDFEVSGLKLIKVPIRIHLKIGSMNTQKKVTFDFFLSFQDLGFGLIEIHCVILV